MLVHRNYRDSSGSIIKIYDDRIEFYNPGGLYGNLTKEKLLKFNYQPQARNKMLAKAFKLIGKVEKYGSGIKRIFSLCKDYGVALPEINITDNGFQMALFKRKINEGINEGIKRLYDYIKMNSGNRISQIESELKVPAKTLERWIKDLKKANKIIYKGSKKTGGYFAV